MYMHTMTLAFALTATAPGPVAGLPTDAPPAPVPQDTLVQVDPGTRVVIRSHEGSIVVRGWDRDAVEVIAEDEGEEARIRVSRSSGALAVSAAGSRGEPADADLTVNVPTGSPLEVHAPFANVQIEGAGREVRVETVDGDIRLTGGAGVVRLQTVEGQVDLRGASGRIEVNSVDGDLRLAEISGDVSASTVDGDVRLEGVASSAVKATTVDGDVTFTGELRSGGVYRLSTHDGDLVVAVPEGAGTVVSIATYDGEFSASFPIDWEGRRDGKRMEFTLGDGDGRLELQSFDGEIRLIRPGERISDER